MSHLMEFSRMLCSIVLFFFVFAGTNGMAMETTCLLLLHIMQVMRLVRLMPDDGSRMGENMLPHLLQICICGRKNSWRCVSQHHQGLFREPTSD